MNYEKLAGIAADVKLPNDMYFDVGFEETINWVRVRKDNDICNVTKRPNYTWYGRRWIIEDHYDESHVLRTLWHAFISAMEHELREQFIYQGKLPFSAHFNIDDLMAKADEVTE